MVNFCKDCGSPLKEESNFCPGCGSPVTQSLKEASIEAVRAKATGAVEMQILSITEHLAVSWPGEVALGWTSDGAGVSASSLSSSITKETGESFKQFIVSIYAALQQPKRLLPAIVLATMWFVLNILQAFGIAPPLLRVLSFLTYAEGGMNGGFLGTIGGIIGKSMFAGAVTLLVSSSTRKCQGDKQFLGRTLKNAFCVTLDTLWVYLMGIGMAFLLYLFISGGGVKMSFMGGIAATYLTARAVWNQGFLQRLIGLFVSKRKTKAGTVSLGLIRGLAIGFTMAALTGLTESNLLLLLTGCTLVIGGLAMTIMQAQGIIKLRKEAHKE